MSKPNDKKPPQNTGPVLSSTYKKYSFRSRARWGEPSQKYKRYRVWIIQASNEKIAEIVKEILWRIAKIARILSVRKIKN